MYASDIAAPQLAALRQAVSDHHLSSIIVIEGAVNSANLPNACCDVIFMRDVYHHLCDPELFNRSLLAALKPGGRLGIIDFEPRSGSKTPECVPASRTGHGITVPAVISEMIAIGLHHARTITKWPPDEGGFFLVVLERP